MNEVDGTGAERSPAELRRLFRLDPGLVFLNHGSFGACPHAVLEAQTRLRDRMERDPVDFFVHQLPDLLDAAREEVARFVDARPSELVFVRNATAGVNAVLRSLDLAAGDELLTTDHGYNACRNVLDFVAERAGARVVVAEVPFPLDDPGEVLDAVRARITPRTRLALIDHVTSPTGLVFPIAELVAMLRERGVETLVDGAHAPGMLPLSVRSVGAAYYTANFHKWVCAPKGAGFLHVRPDRQAGLHPAVISHGYNFQVEGRSRFQLEFDWAGTDDVTSWLTVPEALRYVGGLVPGGWPEIQRRNRALVIAGRALLCDALGVAPPAPESMLGSLAAVPISDGPGAPPRSPLYADPLHSVLHDRHRVQVPVLPWPAPPKRLVRISAHIYNDSTECERLAVALEDELGLR